MENVKHFLHHCILTLMQSSVVEGYHSYLYCIQTHQYQDTFRKIPVSRAP